MPRLISICALVKNVYNSRTITSLTFVQSQNMSAEERLAQLARLYVSGVQNSNGQALSIESLLDVLVVLYDECCNTTLRREKNISEFVDFGES